MHTDSAEIGPRALRERTVHYADAKVRYFEGGSGSPAIVFVHGLTGAASNWFELAEAIAATNRVIVPDLPGHAGSAPVARGATISDFATCVLAVVEEEEAAPALLVGHSLGGLVSLRAAALARGQVCGVVLVAAAGISTLRRAIQLGALVVARVQPGRLLARSWRRRGHSELIRRLLLNRLFAADALAPSDAAMRGLLLGHLDHTDVVAAAHALRADDIRMSLTEVTCPVLILWGAKDRQVPVADAFEYARRLRAPLRVVADAGHVVMLERPEAVLDCIAALLAQIRSASAD